MRLPVPPAKRVVDGDYERFVRRDVRLDEPHHDEPQLVATPPRTGEEPVEAGDVLEADRSGGPDGTGDRMPAELEHPAAHQRVERVERRRRETAKEAVEQLPEARYDGHVQHGLLLA